MNPLRIEGLTTDFGKPRNWNPERDGHCGVLPVYMEGNRFLSVWAPSPEERERIAAGQNIVLSVVGGQPPVMLDVQEITGEEVDLSQ